MTFSPTVLIACLMSILYNDVTNPPESASMECGFTLVIADVDLLRGLNNSRGNITMV